MNCGIVFCVLPAFCLLPSAFCLLPSVYCLQRVVRAQRRRDLLRIRLGREVFACIDEPVGLELVLLVVERAIAPAERQQLLVSAALDDLAVLEDENLIGAPDRRQAMGYH